MSLIPLNYFNNLTPSGTVLYFAGTTAPSGWLLCNGAAISRTTYAALYAVIAETHGQGDNSTTFNLPDYRGRFLRGCENRIGSGALRDPDKDVRTAMATGGAVGDRVGSVQTDTYGSHNHGGGAHTHTYTIYEYLDGVDPGGSYWRGTRDSSTGSSGTIIDTQGGNETRPENAFVNFIIKI